MVLSIPTAANPVVHDRWGLIGASRGPPAGAAGRFLVGSAVGGPKLWPRFSPNKTWSGFVGGLLAGMIAGAAMAGWLDMGRLNAFWGGVLGLAAALATMAGDLWESALKRRFGVKDAGNIIPGHGGLLDRVDGLMFAVVVVAAGRVIVLMLGQGA